MKSPAILVLALCLAPVAHAAGPSPIAAAKNENQRAATSLGVATAWKLQLGLIGDDCAKADPAHAAERQQTYRRWTRSNRATLDRVDRYLHDVAPVLFAKETPKGADAIKLLEAQTVTALDAKLAAIPKDQKATFCSRYGEMAVQFDGKSDALLQEAFAALDRWKAAHLHAAAK